MNFVTVAMLSLALLTCACGSDITPANATTEAASPPVALGATGKATGVDFTVTEVTTPKQIGPDGAGPKAETGETFVVVTYTLKNTGSQNLGFLERPALSLVDPAGRTYSPDEIAGPLASATMEDPTGMSSDLNPNVSAKAKAAWKVDVKAFDKAAWRLVVATDPQLTFNLK